ncbi:MULTISPECIES: transposase [Mesorhizobium]|uniref:transposase n=2 Tax=Phyllobacteriaceae TaxID=69277 RepID=UPI000A73BAC6|nr:MULTISPECIES: transposase [Mesorhizobium]MCF6098509.1 transposase [Mesorhizobium muleiense]RWP12932.1 MAG: hypothetical protein EOR00_25860 [Mesorhizobium sp.]TIV01493.1 MAG: transposase [Mesorhizobium sp.]
MQSLLGRSHWDADRLRDEVRDYVVEALGDEDGVPIVDETGFVKKGALVPPVSRERRGGSRTARSACSWLTRAATAKRWSIVAESWTNDRARCAKASIPETVEFATKPKMARAMVEAALCLFRRSRPFLTI